MANVVSLNVNDTGYIKLPAGTTAQRPASPSAGMIRYNTTVKADEYYDGTKWVYNGDNNIIDPSTWVIGTTGSQTGFGRNGTDAENHIISDDGPFVSKVGASAIWEARPDATSGADGGWNGSYYTIDPQYKYRFSVWVQRTVAGNGHFYLGCYGLQSGSNIGVARRSDGSNNTNPYFEVNQSWSQWSENSTYVWYLVVGHVWPLYSGQGAADPDTGVYKLDGTKLTGNDGLDFVWQPNTNQTMLRTYLYYSTNTATRQQFVYPRIDRIDGSQPTREELILGRFAF